jgi:hypothetical protein
MFLTLANNLNSSAFFSHPFSLWYDRAEKKNRKKTSRHEQKQLKIRESVIIIFP